VTRAIRYNRSPETKREQSEAQKRRVLPARECVVFACWQTFTPKAGNQLRCPACIASDPFNNRVKAKRRRLGLPLKGWHHEAA
jgi:hypothetical protein